MRVDALYAHYGIDQMEPHAGGQLALALAFAHVPGFQTRKPGRAKPGRRRTWTTGESIELWAKILDAKGSGRSIRNACVILTKRKDSPYFGQKAGTLLRRHYEAFGPSGRLTKAIDMSIAAKRASAEKKPK